MAQENLAAIAPVGAAWENVRFNAPEIQLYADDTHPNLTGSYLAACVLYGTLFRDNPVGLIHPDSIDAKTAAYLQTTAQEVLSAHSRSSEGK